MRSTRGRLLIYAMTVLSITALSVLPLAFAGSTYSWTVSCKRTGGLVGNVIARWNWTSNGASVQGNIAFCSATPGTGTVPANANGIIATLQTSFARGAGCFNQDSVTKSFAPGTVPSISLKSFCSTTAYGQRDIVTATFTLS